MEDFEEKLNSILSSPEAMGQIMALANSLSGEGEQQEENAPQPPSSAPPVVEREENPFALLQSMDPAMLRKAMTLFRAYQSGGSEKTALLEAMRPFLREEKREKLDKAIQISRFSRLIRVAMEEFRGGAHV